MEMGKGYAFVGRQQHIHTEKQDYYIDLVFYNYILKCFVLIDLKTEKISHQDVGQMDMYIRMYDELKRGEGDGPTIGIVLYADTDEDIARYSVMHGNEQLFASKYKLYLPTEEELRAEIKTRIAEQMGIGRGTAHKYLVEMDEWGMLSYQGRKITTERTEKMHTSTFRTTFLAGCDNCTATVPGKSKWIKRYRIHR